jgi:hypothetical protein
MAYLTIELKTNAEGGTAAEVLYSGKDERVADQKYHQALATAATSGRPCHACVILDSEGLTHAQKAYVAEVE